MYTRLIKVVKDTHDNEYCACVYAGTDMCQIHKGVTGCAECPMLSKIFSQLHEFENVYMEIQEEKSENK